MPVSTIPYQPTTAQLLAAYRPIVLKVLATATGGDPVPPFVVCDIYIADVYYKSIIRTTAETAGEWYFDISDALQEYLQPDIAVITNNNILQAPHMSAKVLCKFRSSDVDADGFTVEEGTKPVQGTRLTDPVSGTGLSSNEFFVINSSLQHEDNQNLASHLSVFKQGSWSADAYPLSHRNKYFFCPGDSDHFPVIYKGDCLSAELVLNYRLRGQTVFSQAVSEDLNICNPITFQTSVSGNQVTVDLDDPVPSGHSVVVQYKKQADSVWIDAGNFNTQSFSFNVNGASIAGDYDLRVIHFCDPCLSSDPATDTFTLDGSEGNLDWRGINPICEVSEFEAPIYATLELRDPITSEIWIPNNVTPVQKITEDKADLYVKFFSDAAHLNPVNVTGSPIKIYVKKSILLDQNNVGSSVYSTSQTVTVYSISPAGVNEFLLEAALRTNLLHEYYGAYPTVDNYNESTYTYTPYPTHELQEGNTGGVAYQDLEEYNTDTGIPTGNTKPNDIGDPDYIAPDTNFNECPSGPPQTTVTYGSMLEVAKVEFAYSAIFTYAQTVANTQSGNYLFVYPIPRLTNINIAVKARTNDPTNLTGFVKARVNYVDGGGAPQTAEFNVPDNIETTLPQVFQNVNNINISNL